MIKNCWLVWVVAVICFPILWPEASAQERNVRVVVANLNEDVKLLKRQVKTLRLEIEELHKENDRLREKVESDASTDAIDKRLTRISTELGQLRREYREADKKQKEAIIDTVTQQIDALAREMEKNINSGGRSSGGGSSGGGSAVNFSNDYPKTGIKYKVLPGDTLSGIARTHGSKTKYIQDANKIVNPARDLKVGETIFIPIPEED
ncbi:MAG: LysM peptidoglycan-binding domain-containing protein [Opitutales bacterium]